MTCASGEFPVEVMECIEFIRHFCETPGEGKEEPGNMKGSRSKIIATLITIPAALMLCAFFACESQQNRVPTDGERPQDGAVGGLRIVVNGEELSGIPENFYSIEALMLPLNAICEALGYKVDLTEDGLEFTVSDGTRSTKSVIGENQYTRISDARQDGDTQVFRLNRAPQLIDGGIFVPAEFFAQVLGESYLIEKGVLTFTAAR
jgi:hypothetical protein